MSPFFSRNLAFWLICVVAATAGAGQVTYEMVPIGNPGNPDDTGGSHIGAVAYSYQMGKFDVTIGQYTAFLNAADPDGTNPNGLYTSSLMAGDTNIAGISYAPGAASGVKYSVMNNGGDSSNRPITWVSWYNAAMFANWMTNGQGNGSLMTGAYDLATAAPGIAPAKTPGAAFYIPTQSEWYKAAYYDPTLNSGSGGYWTYATQSNTAPGNIVGSAANQANYFNANLVTGFEGVYSVTQSSEYNPDQNYLTDVGAFSGSGSFYGTFDQNGNVYQWNDLDGTAGLMRGFLGGSWNDIDPFNLMSSFTCITVDPAFGYELLGFRIASPISASVPEIDPSSFGSALALLMGSLGLVERRARRALGLTTVA